MRAHKDVALWGDRLNVFIVEDGDGAFRKTHSATLPRPLIPAAILPDDASSEFIQSWWDKAAFTQRENTANARQVNDLLQAVIAPVRLMDSDYRLGNVDVSRY